MAWYNRENPGVQKVLIRSCSVTKNVNKSSSVTCKIAMMRPKRPMAEPKISMMRILTKSVESAASANAAPDPTMPTQIPHARLQMPTVSPAPNILKPGTHGRRKENFGQLITHRYLQKLTSQTANDVK